MPPKGQKKQATVLTLMFKRKAELAAVPTVKKGTKKTKKTAPPPPVTEDDVTASPSSDQFNILKYNKSVSNVVEKKEKRVELKIKAEDMSGDFTWDNEESVDNITMDLTVSDDEVEIALDQSGSIVCTKVCCANTVTYAPRPPPPVWDRSMWKADVDVTLYFDDDSSSENGYHPLLCMTSATDVPLPPCECSPHGNVDDMRCNFPSIGVCAECPPSMGEYEDDYLYMCDRCVRHDHHQELWDSEFWRLESEDQERYIHPASIQDEEVEFGAEIASFV